MSDPRAGTASSTREGSGSDCLLIPLDADEALLALARFRYSAQRDEARGASSGAPHERPNAG